MLCLPRFGKSSTSKTFSWNFVDVTSRFPSRNLRLSAIHLKTTLHVSKWPNWTKRFVPGPSIFWCDFFTFATTLKKGSSKLSMSRQNISSLIFLRNLCPVTNICASVTKLWVGHPLHLLNTRECEVIVGSAPKCLPTSVPVLPILFRAILYALQYLYSFPPIVRLFYLMLCLHPYLFLVSIQPGILFTYDYPNPPEYKTKLTQYHNFLNQVGSLKVFNNLGKIRNRIRQVQEYPSLFTDRGYLHGQSYHYGNSFL